MSDSKNEARNPNYVGKPEADKPSAKPVIERVREWQHGPVPEGRQCDRVDKPVYTPPGSLPEPCGRGWIRKDRGCGADEWRSKGIVLRDKNNKKVVGPDSRQ